MMQLFLVYIVIAMAVLYSGYRIWQSLANPKNGDGGLCSGCTSCNGCELAKLKKNMQEMQRKKDKMQIKKRKLNKNLVE